MICLSDNDIIYKLAYCDLLNESLTTLNLATTDVYVLPTAKYKFGVVKKQPQKRNQPTVVFDRLRNFLGSVHEIAVSPVPQEFQLLSGIDSIDAGEAVLFSVTGHFDDYLLATGDKTSLRTLSMTAVCRPIATKLQGHVIIFEQIIQRIIANFGFRYTKQKVIPALNCDSALRAAFGSGQSALEATVLTALDAYINELRSLPVDLLV